jgi:molybdate transport system permease protein
MLQSNHKKSILTPATYTCLGLFICTAFLSILFNIAEWKKLSNFFEIVMWSTLFMYFILAISCISSKIRGKRNRIFSILSFIPLALFIFFALLMITADALYIDKNAVINILTSRHIRDSLKLSIVTSVITVIISLLFAVPMGYILSRHNFPGKMLADTIVDIPIVFPPLVAGLTLLVFFSQTTFGIFIQEGLGISFVFQPKGIILCQFVVSASFAIRSVKSAFDDIDKRLEKVALTLGSTHVGSFFKVTLPMASKCAFVSLV